MTEEITAERISAGLTKTILENIEKRRQEFVGDIHLTDLFGCPYRKRRYKEGVFIRETKAMALWRGKSLHYQIEHALRLILGKGEVEKTYVLTYLIGGREVHLYLTPDFIAGDCVIEIKTVRRVRFDRRTRTSLPYPHDLAQLRAYIALLGKEKGFLVYYELLGNRFVVFEEKLGRGWKERVKNDVIKRLEMWVKGEFPRKSEWRWECRFCEFIEECVGVEK